LAVLQIHQAKHPQSLAGIARSGGDDGLECLARLIPFAALQQDDGLIGRQRRVRREGGRRQNKQERYEKS
jgi:hypothetical protein